MRLLDGVVHNLADSSKANDAILQFISAFCVLSVSETLLFRNQHFVNSLVKWNASSFETVVVTFAGRDGEMELVFLSLVHAFDAINKVLLSLEESFRFEPQLTSFVIHGLSFCWDNAQKLLETFVAFLCRNAIDNVEQDRKKLVLGRVALFVALGLIVAETIVKHFQKTAKVNAFSQIVVHFPYH